MKDEFPEVYAQLLPVPWNFDQNSCHDFLDGLTCGSPKRSGGGALKLRKGHPVARMSIFGKPPYQCAACKLQGVCQIWYPLIG